MQILDHIGVWTIVGAAVAYLVWFFWTTLKASSGKGCGSGGGGGCSKCGPEPSKPR